MDVDNLKVSINHCDVESSFVGKFGVGVVDFLATRSFRNDDLNFAYREACLLESGSILSKQDLFRVWVIALT